MFTYTAVTFNGNTVIGKGETLREAELDAENKAQAIGSCIRKRITIKQDAENKAQALYLVSVYGRLSKG